MDRLTMREGVLATLLSLGLMSCAPSSGDGERASSRPGRQAERTAQEADDRTSLPEEAEPEPEATDRDSPNRARGFMSLAPPLGAPLPDSSDPVQPPPPSGWTWHTIDGALCRDGSKAGFYVRRTSSDKLLWYLEGGGACSSPGFCAYNPKSADEVLLGDGQTALGTIGGAFPGRQQPGRDGIFSTTNAANPFRDWNQIYVPYCTGDVYFGTRRDATVPGMSGGQQFVGHLNMQKFAARIVPTFASKVDRVVLAGASAGGFGAVLNYSMVQDAFDEVPVVLLNDSAPAFADKYFPPCMQKRWRELWGMDAALPEDCEDCFAADGGNLLQIMFYLEKKHPNLAGGIISSTQDEIIRLFFSAGLNDCAGFETADPVLNFLTGIVPGDQYAAGLDDLRSALAPTGKFASYYIAGINHQHTFRPRFFTAAAGGVTIAEWTTDLLAGKLSQVGP